MSKTEEKLREKIKEPKKEGEKMSLVYLLLDENNDCWGVFSTKQKALDEAEELLNQKFIKYWFVRHKKVL